MLEILTYNTILDVFDSILPPITELHRSVKLAVTVTVAVTVTAAKVVKLAAIVTAAKVVKLAPTATANSEHFLSSIFYFSKTVRTLQTELFYHTYYLSYGRKSHHFCCQQ